VNAAAASQPSLLGSIPPSDPKAIEPAMSNLPHQAANKTNTSFSGPVILRRRSLLQTAAIGGLATLLARPLHAMKLAEGDLPYLDRIGLQLYTVRNQMADDAAATLKAVADAGYRQVELMNVDEEAVELSAIARDNGMAVHSAFMNFRAITSPDNNDGPDVEQTIDLAQRIGLRHIVFGYITKEERDTLDKCREIADRANEMGHQVRQAGMRLCYHNHSFEFEPLGGGQSSFDPFMQRFDPQKVDFELDVFWAKIGGKDPLHLMRKLAGRITQLHLKDLKDGMGTIYDEGQVPADAFQELGDGIIDMPQVIRLAEEIGVDQCHVEQDQSPAPLDSIAQSVNFLRGKS